MHASNLTLLGPADRNGVGFIVRGNVRILDQFMAREFGLILVQKGDPEDPIIAILNLHLPDETTASHRGYLLVDILS